MEPQRGNIANTFRGVKKAGQATSRGTRLNKYLASCGVASRRRADELIAGGSIRVNGRAVTKLGTIIAPGDRVEVDGSIVEPAPAPTYLLLNKPVGMLTTMRDPQGRATVADLLRGRARVVPVGRLDYDTSGALLLTDDGDLAYRLAHPRFGVEKTYRAQIAGRLSSEELRRLREGVWLGDYRTAPAKVRITTAGHDRTVVELTIHEGRNRQVRRMFQSLGHRVIALTRTRFGPLAIGGLPPGRLRPLTANERKALERHRRPPDESPRTKSNTTIAAK